MKFEHRASPARNQNWLAGRESPRVVITTDITSGDFIAVPSTAVGVPAFDGFHKSSHIARGKALGGNILFLDSHVEWRKLLNMKARYNSSSPWFWF